MPGCTTDIAEGFSPLLSDNCGSLTTDLALLALVPLGSAAEHLREEEGTGKGVKTAEDMAMAIAMAACRPESSHSTGLSLCNSDCDSDDDDGRSNKLSSGDSGE